MILAIQIAGCTYSLDKCITSIANTIKNNTNEEEGEENNEENNEEIDLLF